MLSTLKGRQQNTSGKLLKRSTRRTLMPCQHGKKKSVKEVSLHGKGGRTRQDLGLDAKSCPKNDEAYENGLEEILTLLSARG